MNCPQCGSSVVAEQQFCRSCGTVLTAGTPRRFDRRLIGLVTLSLVFLGLLVSVTGGMLELRWLTFTGIFIMIAGMFSVAASTFLRATRPKNNIQNLRTLSKILPATVEKADTTNKLLPIGSNDFIPSVTEGTTDLLKVPAASDPLSSGRVR